MMKLTRPKSGNPNLFYVSSESKPNSTEATHIVVKFGPWAFCDCRNFMVTKLTKLGAGEFTPCKHGKFVLDSVKMADSVGATVRDAIRIAEIAGPEKVVSRIELLHRRSKFQS